MKKWYPLIILALAMFIMVLDSTVMNVSISAVVSDLDTTVSALQACITFYALTMAALMLTGGKLGDKFGRRKAFIIGSIIYGIGSFITSISPNIQTLFVGWSVIEGLGAVLVIPAIAALVAVNYKGRDRAIAYAAIGGISGAAAAAGPLIGGFMTTYLSWRYVFLGETIIMAIVLLFVKLIAEGEKSKIAVKIDLASVLMSITGLTMIVFGMLQSKVWGWVIPLNIPEINGRPIAPLGISIVAYLIIFGMIILYGFYRRQQKLETAKKNPLLSVSMLKIAQLRAGLMSLGGQYLITAAVFFVIPVYLQMLLGYDALQTGIKILPLSIAVILASVVGQRLVTKYTPKNVTRLGQLSLVLGAFILIGAINPQLKGFMFGLGMFVVGAGLGLLASQLGNVNMSSVPEKLSSEAGGLQGTFQNFGSSLGTALIGSIMMATLASQFVTTVNADPNIPQNTKTAISQNARKNIQIVPVSEVSGIAESAGLNAQEAQSLESDYATSQVNSLKLAMFFIAIIGLLMLAFSRNIPNKKLADK